MYRRGCHCRRCTDAISRQAKARVTAQHNGTYRLPFTDCAPSRQRLELLLSTGLMLGEISRLSGVNHDTLRRILGRRKDRPGVQVSYINERKIMAVRVSLDRLSPTALIAATGTRRRLQALGCLGWHSMALAERVGVRDHTLNALRSGRQQFVRGSTARAVRDVYERLAGTDAAALVGDPSKARGMVNRSRRERWVSPDRWFEVSIDDPHAAALPRQRVVRHSSADLVEDAEFLMEQLGYDRPQAAGHLGVLRDTLDRAFARVKAPAVNA
jgi:hypothetical protein